MSSIQSDVPEMNLASNRQTPAPAMDARVANETPFRLRLAGRSSLCVDTKDAMLSLAPCDHKATSQVFKYDMKTKSVVINGTNECLGYDEEMNIKLCSSPSASQTMAYSSSMDKFFLDKPVKLCLDNVAGETAGVPLSLTATKCDVSKRSQEFDILSATGGRLPPLPKYPEMKGEFNIALTGSNANCLSVSGAAVSCSIETTSDSRQFVYSVAKNQFIGLGTQKCVTAGESEAKSCANDNANQVFVYDYAQRMFRGSIDNVKLCFAGAKRSDLMPAMLRWCKNNQKPY